MAHVYAVWLGLEATGRGLEAMGWAHACGLIDTIEDEDERSQVICLKQHRYLPECRLFWKESGRKRGGTSDAASRVPAMAPRATRTAM